MELSDTTLEKKGISRWVWVGCVLLVIAAGLHSADEIVGGGDTWVAMECGRFTVGPWAMNHPGRTWQMRLLDKFGIHITNKDPYSAASRSYIPGDHENFGWVNQNWLTHVIFYWLTHESPIADPDTFPPSFNQLVYWKIAIYIITVICVYYT
ncbi:MAG: hypothetical protein KAT56_05250, partial [Sedimentisphaerales bacterium]|nr:hypothetical protein [Sedimentisphaerales bacterium]